MDIYMPIDEAESIMQVSLQVLKNLVKDGKIRATMLNNGAILLNERNILSRIPLKARPEYKRFIHLAGNLISLSDAERKYGIDNSILSRWVSRGFISKLGQSGRRVLVDEAEVAAYALIYHDSNGHQGKWIFDREGNPYVKKNC